MDFQESVTEADGKGVAADAAIVTTTPRSEQRELPTKLTGL